MDVTTPEAPDKEGLVENRARNESKKLLASL